MTLVIAGHDIEKSSARPGYQGAARGLFVVADSTITSGTQTLLNGFKKIYSVPIKIYKPSFNGVYFRNYHYIHHETSCFVAFAGRTLTAQHVLNAISNHLRELHIGHEFPDGGRPGTYKILMDCEPNSLFKNAGIDEWDEDMFVDSDMADLLSGEVVSSTVLHSIRGALAGAKKYKIDEAGWNSLLTDYVLGTYCEVQKRHRLYTFITSFKKDSYGVIDGVEVDVKEILQGELVVLGLDGFTVTARQEYLQAFQAGKDVKTAMFDFLNSAIDQVQANGGREIDRPSVLRAFSRGTLTELNRKP